MQTTIQQALAHTTPLLASVSDASLLEAEILLAFVLQKERSYLYAWPQTLLTTAQQTQFAAYVKRRLQKEPIAYLTGTKEFWSLPLRVTPDTLTPRPETELLVEHVLAAFAKTDCIRIADLGTGSGAIAAALASERPHWEIIAVDNNASALAVAKANAQRLGFKNIQFYCGNWCEALPMTGFTAIISNPPYIAETEWQNYADGLSFEPRAALVSGEDGLSAIRDISRQAKQFLTADGRLFLEHGSGQGAAVRAILSQDSYKNAYSVCDLSGNERISMAQSEYFSLKIPRI